MTERFKQTRLYSGIIAVVILASFLSSCTNIENPATTNRDLPPNRVLPTLVGTATPEPTATPTRIPPSSNETCLTIKNHNDTGILTRQDQTQWIFSIYSEGLTNYNAMALKVESNSVKGAGNKDYKDRETGNDMKSHNDKTSFSEDPLFGYLLKDGLSLECSTKQLDPNSKHYSYLYEIDSCQVKCDPHLWTVQTLSPTSVAP